MEQSPGLKSVGQGRGSGKFRNSGAQHQQQQSQMGSTEHQAQLQVEEGPLLRGSPREACRSVEKYGV